MEDKKIIFGLSPRATLVNSVVLLVLSSVFWVLRFVQQMPPNVKDLKSLKIEVEWYYDLPLQLLSIIMVWRWVEFKFDLKPGEFSWKAIKYKFFYAATLFWFINVILKFELLLIFLPK